LKVFFSAIKGSLDMADRTLKEYQETQLRLAAKETVDALARIFREEEAEDAEATKNTREQDDDSIPQELSEEDLEIDDTPDPEDTSGFGGSFEKFKKSGMLVN
jgi:hypothetical protein